MSAFIEPNNQNIQIGDKVLVTRPWREDETISRSNFHVGTVKNVYHTDSETVRLLKFDVAGVENPVSADRIRLIAKSNVRDLPRYVHLKEDVCASVLKSAESKGFRAFISAQNFDRTELEVENSETSHKVTLKFSETSDEIFARCDCKDFLYRNHICRDIAFVGITEVFPKFEQEELNYEYQQSIVEDAVRGQYAEAA